VPVVIVSYNPQWPVFHESETKLIRAVLGGKILAIEHIGSTAVPNLGGKNIVDIMAGVNSLEEAEQCLAPLESIGYTEVIPQVDNADWYYCLEKSQQALGYHLHLVRFGSEHWKKHVIFRDFLRKHPKVAQEYYALKKELAAKHGTNRLGYTEAKTAFIESVIAKAHQLLNNFHN
jgi:GrpB-like predicted nucleotidyltransferase (UPF0157 family)